MKSKVYLAGGMRSGWQSDLQSLNLDFIDPTDKEPERNLSLNEYGSWDLHYVKNCDIVFAYMEKDNPAGTGMAVEIGYAKGLGKTVILCLEENNQHINDRYLAFMKTVADITFKDFQEAVNYLKLFK